MGFTPKGSFVAIVTPFTTKGRIDTKCLERLVSWQIQEGTEGILCCGSTGEGVTLSEGERKKVATICVETAEKRIPILVNCGTSDTRQSVRLVEMALKMGADGCMGVVPYYNKPTQRGCLLHFSEMAKVGLPLIMYNNPGRTGLWLSAETVVEILKIPGVVAYKDSTGDFDLIRKVKKWSSIPILSGDDDMTFATLQEGGSGAISVIGNIIPRAWKKMISLALEGKWEASKKIDDRFYPLCKAIFLEVNPQCVKFTMSLSGLCGVDLRLPLVPPLPEVQAKIKQKLLSLSLPFLTVQSKVV